jgi:hypothetical protein
METMKHGSVDLQEMLHRLGGYNEKLIKIKLFDGTIIEGILSKLKPKALVEKQINEKCEVVADPTDNAYYLKVENWSLIISPLEISNFEPAA